MKHVTVLLNLKTTTKIATKLFRRKIYFTVI